MAIVLATFSPTISHPGPFAAGSMVPGQSGDILALGSSHRNSESTDGGVLAIGTNDSRAANNSFLESRFHIPALSTEATGSLQVWLVEPLTGSEDLGVGVWVNATTGGRVSLVGLWGTWDPEGAGAIQENSTENFGTGSGVQLSIASAGGGEWSLTVNNLSVPLLRGGLVSLGPTVADPSVPPQVPDLPWGVPTIVVRSFGPFAFSGIAWSTAFAVRSSTSVSSVGDGFVESVDANWGAVGQNQDPAVGADSFNESLYDPELANGSMVWGIGDSTFPPVAAWTSDGSTAYSTPGAALELVVPPATLDTGTAVGLCQELLEPLDNGVWLTVGACWEDGQGVRAYVAVTQADGEAYQKVMQVPLPGAGQEALLSVRDFGGGNWRASVNGVVMVDAEGNASVHGGTDLSNSSQGPYGALRGYPGAALPTSFDLPISTAVYPTPQASSPEVTPEGTVAPSDAETPALEEGDLQDPALVPGQILVLPDQPPIPFETPLWVEPTNASSLAPWGGPGAFELSFLTAAGLAVMTAAGARHHGRKSAVHA